MYVSNLVAVQLGSAGDFDRIKEAVTERRTQGLAACCAHVIVTLSVELSDGQVGKLSFVDLAGSENLHEPPSLEVAKLLKERGAARRGLAALSGVVSALSNGAAHVPYRHSKLTYLLQDALGPETRTVFVAAVRPGLEHCGATLQTLQFASELASCERGVVRKRRLQANDTRATSENVLEQIASAGTAAQTSPIAHKAPRAASMTQQQRQMSSKDDYTWPPHHGHRVIPTHEKAWR